MSVSTVLSKPGFQASCVRACTGLHSRQRSNSCSSSPVVHPARYAHLRANVVLSQFATAMCPVCVHYPIARQGELLAVFRRFPAGIYEIEGETLDGVEMESETELTHVMPAPAEPTVNAESMAVQCDDEEPGYDATEVSTPVTIAWPAVTMSHPDAYGGRMGFIDVAGCGRDPGPGWKKMNNFLEVISNNAYQNHIVWYSDPDCIGKRKRCCKKERRNQKNQYPFDHLSTP